MKKKIIGAVLAALMLGGAVTVGALDTSEDVIVLDAGNNYTLNLEINLIGDDDLNGKVNTRDWNALRDHLNNSKPITDEYALKCADIDQNGKVNTRDWNALRDHLNNSKPLW